MRVNLDTVNWQAISSVLTLAAVATALWPIGVRYREERAREGHVIKSIGLMLIVFLLRLDAEMQEHASSDELSVPQSLADLVDDVLRLHEEAFRVSKPEHYGPLASVVEELLRFRTFESFTREVGQNVHDKVRGYLTREPMGPIVGPQLPPAWGRT